MKLEKSEYKLIPITKLTNLKIMSFNIASCRETSHGIVDIAHAIEHEKPDLVAIQEVDKFTFRSGRRIDQSAELVRLTHLSQSLFVHSMDFDSGQYGNSILSRYTFDHVEQRHLDGQGKHEMRSIGIISIIISNERKLYFGVIHLEDKHENLRLAQVRQAIAICRRVVPDNQPFILAGDFNDLPASQTLNLLLTEGRFRLPCQQCPATHPSNNPKQTIDYILMNRKAWDMFTLKKYRVVNITKVSDHLPLIMELSFS
jgi:endonuclease/exonuclease/phosphatase family metal-dependent hydrolase